MNKILVVEDDKKIAAALSIRLKGAGYEVVTASDGLQGLTSAIQMKPDLIILDIWLPGAIGFLIAERLKNVGLGGIPLIFITASKKKDLWKLAQEVGAAGFFEKPYDPEKLLRTIAGSLGQTSAVLSDHRNAAPVADPSAVPSAKRRKRENSAHR